MRQKKDDTVVRGNRAMHRVPPVPNYSQHRRIAPGAIKKTSNFIDAKRGRTPVHRMTPHIKIIQFQGLT
jgi:hypothetical protein